MSDVFLYPDGFLPEFEAELGVHKDDFAKDRFLYPPFDERRYSESGKEKMRAAGHTLIPDTSTGVHSAGETRKRVGDA